MIDAGAFTRKDEGERLNSDCVGDETVETTDAESKDPERLRR